MRNGKGDRRRFRVGVDVGGTFTDVVLVEETTGEILVAKVATVPVDPSEGCVNAIDKAARIYGLTPEQFVFTVHGTTIATNTIIEGKGARGGLITSAGFRDVLEIAYQTRPKLYDVFYEKAKPLIPRYLCRGVPERLDADGTVLVPLDEDAVRAVVRELAAEGVEAIAVALLHSYKDPAHERRIGEILAEELPDMPVVLSSDISPEYREYPRTSTAVVNAVLQPRVGPYIARLEERLEERAIRSGLHLMSSSGGIIAANVAKRHPVHLIESGPAAGVIGAAFIAQLAGHKNLLALDIGGTTAKAALVNDGTPRIAEQFEVGSSAVATVTAQRGQGYPVLTPVISLVEIGAGGGSIAHVDPGGVLTVGPRSAGAVPGPACYGRGGTDPTLTDANLVLGRINPEYFLGGETKLEVELARKAVLEWAAKPAGLDLIEAAQAIIDIANAKMTSALHFISVEQGIDPRDYVLVPSGGAGPMQAVAIARALGVRTVLIPPTPGLNSAVGLLATDLKHELVRTYMKVASQTDPVQLARVFGEMEASTRELLREEGVTPERIRIVREIAMCYVGQSYQLKIEVPNLIDGETWKALTVAFHRCHATAYGFANEREPVQFVNLRITGIGQIDRPKVRQLERAIDGVQRALKTRREVYFGEAGGMVMTDVYERALLLAGDRFSGPAIVEQMDCTTVISPDTTVAVDDFGNLVVSLGEARSRTRSDTRERVPAEVSTIDRADLPAAVRPAMDPVTFEVIRNALVNITEEMAVTIRRAAFSTNIKTRADFSCAFFDTSLRCIAQSFAQPAHLVAMSVVAPNSIREYGQGRFRPGDSIIVNDPHRGASHLNDITVITAVDFGGRRLGYVANMAHHVDVGGSQPASLGVNRELFQEGIILPPTLVAAAGKIDDNVLNLILANIRAPRETNGDLRAQLSANVVGALRMGALTERYGQNVIESFFDELIAYTERWVDCEIRKLPAGVYDAEGFRDDDGITDRPVKLHAKVTIGDGHVRLDVTGSDLQRACPINCNRAMATTAAAFVTRCLIDDRIPVNEGLLRRVHLDGPDGLICTAKRPAAVVGGWELVSRLTELVFLALHPALPDRIPAAGKGCIVNIGFGGQDPRRGEFFCYMETIGGGNGARPGKNGPDGVQTNVQNTENAPIEEVELGYPIRIRLYELIQDSCGAGKYRGGLGIRRDFEFPHAPCSWTVLSDGRKFAPWGLKGGGSGRPQKFIFDPQGETRDLPSKCTIEVPKNGRVRVETAGGGGFGNPLERDREDLLQDIRDGKISAAKAEELYGMRG